MGGGLYCFLRVLPPRRAVTYISCSFNARTDLAWGDVAVDDRDSPTMVQVHLKTSKVDQFGQGVDVTRAYRGGVMPCTGTHSLPAYQRLLIGTVLPCWWEQNTYEGGICGLV